MPGERPVLRHYRQTGFVPPELGRLMRRSAYCRSRYRLAADCLPVAPARHRREPRGPRLAYLRLPSRCRLNCSVTTGRPAQDLPPPRTLPGAPADLSGRHFPPQAEHLRRSIAKTVFESRRPQSFYRSKKVPRLTVKMRTTSLETANSRGENCPTDWFPIEHRQRTQFLTECLHTAKSQIAYCRTGRFRIGHSRTACFPAEVQGPMSSRSSSTRYLRTDFRGSPNRRASANWRRRGTPEMPNSDRVAL